MKFYLLHVNIHLFGKYIVVHLEKVNIDILNTWNFSLPNKWINCLIIFYSLIRKWIFYLLKIDFTYFFSVIIDFTYLICQYSLNSQYKYVHPFTFQISEYWRTISEFSLIQIKRVGYRLEGAFPEKRSCS